MWRRRRPFTKKCVRYAAQIIDHSLKPLELDTNAVVKFFYKYVNYKFYQGDTVEGSGVYRPAGGIYTEVSAFKPIGIDDKGKFNTLNQIRLIRWQFSGRFGSLDIFKPQQA